MNIVLMIGNLTRNPEYKTSETGVSVCRFSIAVNRRKSENTDYFNIAAFRGLADICAKYLHKGSKVSVTGELQIRSYDKDGVKHYATDIIASDVEFLTPKKETQDEQFE